jgi:deferrochelatase/peroxidase EfeB
LRDIEIKLAGTVKTITRADGAVRPDNEAGHEHFGFQDCLSQPPVIGFREPNAGEEPTGKLFLCRCRLLWNSNIYTDPIEPGVILISELGDQLDVTRPTWAKDGSFMVFRKLRQFVPEFNYFLAKNPILDGGLTPAQGSELLGA